MWGSDGKVEIRPTCPNLFIIQLPNAAVRDQIFKQGPWHIQNKSLIVRKWEPGMSHLEFDLSRIPLWIHLRNVPLELFNKKGLNYIASTIGTPLYMDHVTTCHQRLAYAKLCVEVNVDANVPRFVDVKMKNRNLVSIAVEILWHPKKCSHYLKFGLTNKACPKKPNEVKKWMPKKKENDKGKLKRACDEDKQIDKTENKENFVASVNTVDNCEVDNLKNVGQSSNTGDDRKFDSSLISKNTINGRKACSTNRFEILDSAMMNEFMENSKVVEDFKVGHRKPRVALAGVAEVMKTLKVNKKGPIDKGKKKCKAECSASGDSLPSTQ
ncbi:hypothetical protein DITRI_Ditri01bG0017900 [Diplodiscus trichospermus]